MLFDRFDGALIDEEILVVHDVVDIQRVGLDGLRLLEIARCAEKILVCVVRDQKHVKALIALLWGQDTFFNATATVFVFGASMTSVSNTFTSPSFAFLESTEKSATRFIFLFTFCE